MTSFPFYALHDGTVNNPLQAFPWLQQAPEARLRTVDLGAVQVASGLVEAVDIIRYQGRGNVYSVVPGTYQVRATMAAFPPAEGERLAYVTLIFREGEAASIEYAPLAEEPKIGLVSDSGIVGFVDRTAAKECRPPRRNRQERTDYLEFQRLWETTVRQGNDIEPGHALLKMPLGNNGENCSASLGPLGTYEVLLSRDAEGNPLGLHIDMGVFPAPFRV